MQVQCADCDVLYDKDSMDNGCPRCRSYVYKILKQENSVPKTDTLEVLQTPKPINEMTDAEFAEWENDLDKKYSESSPKHAANNANADANADTKTWNQNGFALEGNIRVFCTHKPQEVIDGKTWKVFAGAKHDCKRHLDRYPIVLNLTGISVSAKHSIPIPDLHKWEAGHFQEILLDWHDGEDIDLPLQFWVDLRTYLANTKQNVLIFCMGGHGRTGTAIAALLISIGWKAKDAMEWIWKNYCKEAIETKTQEWYLQDLEEEYIEQVAANDTTAKPVSSHKGKKGNKKTQ